MLAFAALMQALKTDFGHQWSDVKMTGSLETQVGIRPTLPGGHKRVPERSAVSTSQMARNLQ